MIFDKIEFKTLFLKYWRQYSNLIEDLNINFKRNYPYKFEETTEDKNMSRGELSKFITKNQTKIIQNLNNVDYLNNPANQLTITYKDYKSLTNVYKYKSKSFLLKYS